MDLTVYLIGPISGLDYESCMEHFTRRISLLRGYGYNVLHPMLGKEYLRNELSLKAHGYADKPMSSNHAIVQADFWRVDKADMIYADLTKGFDRVSIGTVAEMSRAFYQNKLIVTVMQKENIHMHAFILEMSSIVFETTDEADHYFSLYKSLIM